MRAPRSTPSSPPRLLRQVFAVNAVVLCISAALLALAPVTISAPIALVELAIVLVTLAVMLGANLVVLRRVLAPLDELTALTRDVDPVTGGGRPPRAVGRTAETAELAAAFTAMVERLERERRASVGRALRAQEGERARIARELHDELGQTLTALKLRADGAAQRGDDDAALAEIGAALDDALDEIRRIARELRPEALDDLGLVNALISLCVRMDAGGRARVAWTMDGDPPTLDADRELALYRVAQEAVTNALRHADAHRVEVTLATHDGRVTLGVADDGRGLPDGAGRDGGAGLAGMRERALLVGGNLEVASSPAGGTTVRLTLPATETTA